MNLTPRQIQCLTYIKHALTQSGMAPTYAEIGTALGGISRGNVKALLNEMKAKGAINFSRKFRSIEIVDGLAYRKVLGAQLATAVECHALESKTAPETIIKEAVAAYMGAA